MASPAIAAIFPLGELPAMLVLMTVKASFEGKGCLEVIRSMAVPASYRSMQSEQRKVRSAVIECIAGEDLLPASGGVAACAIASESIAVRVFVARGAITEQPESFILHWTPGRGVRRLMTLVAFHLGMQPCQRELRMLVREAGRIFPGLLRVTLRAMRAQLAGMHIAVTVRAGTIQAGERRVQVMALQHRPVRGIDIFTVMALGAS